MKIAFLFNSRRFSRNPLWYFRIATIAIRTAIRKVIMGATATAVTVKRTKRVGEELGGTSPLSSSIYFILNTCIQA